MDNEREKKEWTPGPWTAHYDDNGFYWIYAEGAPSPYIVATGGEGEIDKANASRIVHCVNTHDALVEALDLIVHNHDEYDIVDDTLWDMARAALSTAKEAGDA